VTAVPLAARERIVALAREIEPYGDPAPERPPRRARQRYVVRYLLALGGLTAGLYAVDRFVPLPGGVDVPWVAALALAPVVVVAAHLKWRHRGWWLGPDHAVTRNGWLRRRTKIVPYYRVQTVIDSRTVFQRRRRLATVTIDTAGSLSLTGGDAAAVDVDYDTADRLRDELDERLRTALAERRGRRARGRALEAERETLAATGDGGRTDADDAGRDGRDGRDDGGFVFGAAADPPGPGTGGDARDAGEDEGVETGTGTGNGNGTGGGVGPGPPEEAGSGDESRGRDGDGDGDDEGAPAGDDARGEGSADRGA
jgi:putative membrane protein